MIKKKEVAINAEYRTPNDKKKEIRTGSGWISYLRMGAFYLQLQCNDSRI